MQVNAIIDQVLENMMGSENHDFRLATQQNILELIERDELLVMERLWPQRKVNMVEFIKIMISVVHHKQCELLYLVMGLIELYKDVVANCQQNELSLSDVTSYVCQVETSQNQMVPQLLIPEPKKFNLNKTRIRDIDVDAPQIIGQSDDEICHIVPDSMTNDSVRHHNGTVQNGFYCNKRIVTLDSLDSKLNVYSIDGILKKQLKITQNEDRETIILSFAWSDRQQRIGMTLKSHGICMYEGDFRNFQIFSTVLASSEYQSNIWYLENLNKWITTDATFKLYEWDLQSQQVVQMYQSKSVTGSIIECVEVVHMKMVATASLDKQVVVWDFNTKDVKLIVSLKDQGGVHSLVYSYYYQVFITCGYSTNINVYEVNPKFHDVTSIGKMSGHTSMLTAITMIGKSPILISGDDAGTLKLWDIRTFACIQSLNFGKKTQISKILDMSEHLSICFLGSRLNILKLDTRKRDSLDNYTFKIEFDQQRDELIVATKKNILFMDIHTGRMKRILNGLLTDLEDEITQYRPLNYFNRFILCDSKGNVKIYHHSGEFIQQLKGHQDVLALKLDILNKLVIIIGQDSISIQSINQIRSPKFLREITPIKASIIELSVHHSLLLASSFNQLFIFDYELAKLLTLLEYENEITALNFIANYPIFTVATTAGKVYFMKFLVKDHVNVTVSIHSIYDILQNNYMTEDGDQDYVIKMILSVKELELIFATNDGNIIRLQLNLDDQQPTQPVYERINYNPLRQNIVENPRGQDPIKITIPEFTSLKHTLMFHASNKLIISLNQLILDNRLIVISSIEGMVKIFELNGDPLAGFNINHPLPLKWDIKYTKQVELRKRIIYGFKVIDILRKQSKTEKEAEIYSLNDSIQVGRQLHLKSPKSSRVVVMRDEFSPRDLKFKKVRHLYQNEIQGPTLKQMEAQRRLLEVQNLFKHDDNRDAHLDEVLRQKDKERQQNLDRQSNLNFLDPEYREKHHLSQKAINNNQYLKEFNNKLENSNDYINQKSIPQISVPQIQNKIYPQKKKSISDFYQYAQQKNLLYEQSILDSFASKSTLKNTQLILSNQLSQQLSNQMSSNYQDQTWHGRHRKQQKDLSVVLSSLNSKLKQSRNSQGIEKPDYVLKDITKSDITFEDQLDEFTKKHKLK